MLPSILRKAHEFSRKLVVRIILIALLAMLAVGLSRLLGPAIPTGLEGLVAADAVDDILSLIADSMLVITTFSLTVMAAAHRAVSTTWTPRAHQMLLQDTVTHTVLATFVGAYLYALLGIVLRHMGVFDGPAVIVLFGMTVLVVLLIVTAIIRWISRLETLGSLIETGNAIEDQAREAYLMRCRFPTLGARMLDGIPDGAIAVKARRSGYIRQIYQDRLQEAAEKAGAHVWLPHQVGAFVFEGQVLAYVDVTTEKLIRAIESDVSLGKLRNFVQDPGFGLACLSEIGVRALSPGINDPGTAVDCIRRIGRILLSAPGSTEDKEEELAYGRLFLPALDIGKLVMEPLRPLLQDGKDRFELQDAVDETLGALSEHPDWRVRQAAAELVEIWRTTRG